MKLKQTLSRPVTGYFDGGPCDTFEWSISPYHTNSETSRVGSTGANYYFEVRTGLTDKATLGNARRALSQRMKRLGITSTFEYI